MSNRETAVNNTYLSEEELEHFKNELVKEKDQANKKIEDLKESIEEIEGSMGDNVSSSAHHQGNIGSSEEQREKKYTLIEKQKDKLEKITVALDRIGTGNYGICIVTGKKIQKERLEVMPYALHCVDAMKGNIKAEGNSNLNVKDSAR